MKDRNRIFKIVYEWARTANPLSHKDWPLVANGGGGPRANENYGGCYLTGRGMNYAVPLSEVEEYSEDVAPSDNTDSLMRFENCLCREIAEKFLEILEFEEWEEAEISPAFTGDSPYKVVETSYGFSLVIGSHWDGMTYAGDVYFPVEGIEPHLPRGLMSVSILMMKTDLPVK